MEIVFYNNRMKHTYEAFFFFWLILIFSVVSKPTIIVYKKDQCFSVLFMMITLNKQSDESHIGFRISIPTQRYKVLCTMSDTQ